MMKKFYMCALLALTALGSKAQIFYSFSASKGTYTPISGGINVVFAQINNITNPSPATDDGYKNNISIGFNFVYNGKTYTRLHACTNGFLSFNPIVPVKTGGTAYYLSSHDLTGTRAEDTIMRPVIAPFWADLDVQDKTTGGAWYKTTGTAPNRVFTFEWSNLLWDYGATDGSLAVQVKLYETTNAIEFIYQRKAGAIIVSDSANRTYNEAGIGLTATVRGKGNFISVQDSTGNPGISKTNEAVITGRPDDNQIYRFTPSAVLTNDASITKVYAIGTNATAADPQGISTVVTNLGTATITNVPVTLVVTGANSYTKTLVLDSVPATRSYIVNFPPYQAVNTGTDYIGVYLPADQDTSNNYQYTTSKITKTILNYSTKPTPDDGFGQASQTIDIAALFSNPNPHAVKNIFLKFGSNNAGPQQFTVAIYDTTGTDKNNLPSAPGSLMWKSDTLTSVPDSEVVVKINPSFNLTGSFFVVVSQLDGTTSLKLGYENENPLRYSTFYFNTPGTAGWVDFGRSTVPYIRPCIGLELDTVTVTPVSFVKFSGLKTEANLNKLSWETAKEVNNKLFEIQRSSNGKEFSTIGTVNSKASTPNQTYSYTYLDNAPLQGTNYYRLKQVDNNGKYAFSNVISIDNKKILINEIAEVYPNPVRADLKVKFNSTKNTTTSLLVTDASGRIVVSKKVSLNEGSNVISLNAAELKAGVYYIKSTDGDSKVSFIKE